MSLLEIRKKVISVGNTRKITKAMQLVAASKMQQFQKKAISSRGYVWDLLSILKENIHGQDLNIYTKTRSKGPILFVIYTSDKGLCGGLNNQLLRSLVRSKKWKETPEKDRMVFTIGKKSLNFAKNKGIPVEKSYIGIPEKLTMLEALNFMDGIFQYWKEEKCREIVFLSPHFHNSFTYYPVFKTVLPLSLDMIETHLEKRLDKEDKKEVVTEKSSRFMLYEPSKEKVLITLYEQIIQLVFIQSFFELKASEYSSRMIAMQSATDSANKIIQELTTTYNKMRQQVITQELAELIGASEAIKDED